MAAVLSLSLSLSLLLVCGLALVGRRIVRILSWTDIDELDGTLHSSSGLLSRSVEHSCKPASKQASKQDDAGPGIHCEEHIRLARARRYHQ
ncbi:hypothetical protein K461DRAFT_32310 [Myriangium duriaei CBS 260.36]|uniref:Secreted protein n=1 Tax=Myriangium duriaei CBS 260.36 TaxID=1168546 RepID=A0A9P4JB41_9PEZI|nr:hypothetical protein K461DRAFT_32310 [Myriangium duriaei CBS 260.36]